jgi:hypothetical protein
MPASWVKAFRDKLATWAAARQPTAGGLYHLLGPYTPDAFKAVAPAAAVAAVKACWWTFWRSKWIGYIRRARIKQAYEEWE